MLTKIFLLFQSRIDALITVRILRFYQHLVNTEQIKHVPGTPPAAT
ncbi:MAG: hypothetical protein ABSA48_00100 [Terracidiphilus sp.]